MDINFYATALGIVLLISGGLFSMVCDVAQDRLLKRWKAIENKWVTRGFLGAGIRIIKENDPPKEFEEEFANSFSKKHVWIAYLSGVLGFILLAIINLLS
ncbi:hypothetical protein Q669_26275 [Labrenzia sp. C1B10]|uniref:hypothetical protein n=1 Tax=Stappiaceae TaxID=2821832 RepID=UPI0003B91697|nr:MULTISPECIES: hypothetical protein [Stappiaceae]ERP97490.1 hypothetical protein Q669_26275 [Labrenzia sp. C1B10]ERS08829.1 hypothetical protein Q675_15580 [Labrenzia sp. C1B70]UFI04519.1 hypothetical protein ST40_005125 [Roseibium aggregatum]